MGFVKTPEELARIQQTLSAPSFLSAEMLTVEFRTRPEIVEHLLPPGLEPADEPIASAAVGRWGRSNCVHAFEGGALYLRARHGDLEGDYCLSMPMSSDRAIIFGRELFGEPKKQCAVEFACSDTAARGRAVRYGAPIIAIDAHLEREEPPTETRSAAFHYKFLPAAHGVGLEADPVLVIAEFDLQLTRIAIGSGTLALGDTVHDPLGEVEIVEITSVTYSEGDIYGRCRALTTVDAEAFLPYAYGKVDDWTALNNEKEAPWGRIEAPPRKPR